MLIFHEGLPGSGKSYEAMVEHVIPAIKKKRPVYTNMEGLLEGAPKIAEINEQCLKEVVNHIHIIPEDEVRQIYKLKDIPDVLVVLDELQDYYPSDMRNIPQEERSYVAKHEHYGHDIIAMGQNLGDCNKLWRNRVARKISFMKRDMIGKPTEYTWQAYAGKLNPVTSEVEFEKINSGGRTYEEKYFGTYKSVNAEVKNKRVNYEDDRSNLLKRKELVFGAPAFIAFLFFGGYTLYSYFTKAPVAEVKAAEIESAQVIPEPPPMKQETKLQAAPVPEVYKPVDYFDKIAHQYTLRFSAAIYDANGILVHALVDAYDSTQHLKERFYLQDIQALGWIVDSKVYGVDISKSTVSYVARPYPLDDMYGKVNQHYAESL